MFFVGKVMLVYVEVQEKCATADEVVLVIEHEAVYGILMNK